jgi:ATP-binding protein involved in chromosome partitioning
MLHSVIQQFLRGVDWGELDYLVIDLPPGTGDVQLSLIQSVPVIGRDRVTTPSDVSLEDARKAIMMFHQVRVPILGIVENMSYLTARTARSASTCSATAAAGDGARDARSLPRRTPLDPEVRIGGDTGEPIVQRKGKGEPFLELARNAIAQLDVARSEGNG